MLKRYEPRPSKLYPFNTLLRQQFHALHTTQDMLFIAGSALKTGQPDELTHHICHHNAVIINSHTTPPLDDKVRSNHVRLTTLP